MIDAKRIKILRNKINKEHFFKNNKKIIQFIVYIILL